MGKVDFDDFADDYREILDNQIRFFEIGSDYFARYKVSVVRRLLQHQPKRILEFGCGIGGNIKHLLQAFPFASVVGCDLSEKCLTVAARDNPSAKFFMISKEAFPDGEKFDLIFVANVFHHIIPEERSNTIKLLKQLMTTNGELYVFEHNPYNPVTRHLVNTCPFDADAHLLKPKQLARLLRDEGFSTIEKKFILFFPSFLRLLRPLERFLTYLPLGGQYVILAIQ